MTESPLRPLGSVASGMRDVARVAAGGAEADTLVTAALDALREALHFERADYLQDSGDGFRASASEDGEGRVGGCLRPEDLPELRSVLDAHRALVLDEASFPDLFARLADYLGGGRDAGPVVVVPILRGGDPVGLLTLSEPRDREEGPIDQRTLEIATVYGALLGLGLAAVARAERLEHLREVLQERNELLSAELSVDADACHALEASVSRPMRTLVQMAKQVARSDAPVLITGETGTGKEVLARAIHEWSDRSDGPFVQLNCAALSDHLIESELFGHVKGAFSGAVSDRAGRFRVADGGTLLLDEIGEMPLEAQTKLLRVLEEGTVLPVGADRTEGVDVRVIAATNVELDLAIDRGRFREDLYFRLHVFPLHLPPLRERTDDIPTLVEQILTRMRRRTGHGPWRVSEDDMARIRRYPWPGNVRELVNALERARVFSPLGGTLSLDVGRGGRAKGRRRSRRSWPTLDEHQRGYIEEVLRHTNGKIYGEGGAAELLGIPPSTLQSRMRRLGVERPES